MFRRLAAAALVVALGASAPAAAWSQGASPPARPQAASPSPKALELVQRLLKATGAENQADLLTQAIITQMAASSNLNLSDEERVAVAHIVRDVMREEVTPKLMARMTPVYARTFTEAELEAMVVFYESPVGQAAITRIPQLMQESIAITEELMPPAQGEILRRLCDRFGCDADSRPTPS
ncbi:conserved hypothetical protein [Phenylobacterium zucineum HLK1]|uniref:DUF2059 domain-containing protein n=1 Tax=Phenylobacterium zucineum (strain HLK1) TaxID=450851 RepID=B4RAF1_PHEZH|nr:DUF2059 domain-containing protein [Phenylobacterium zucineum]ACG77958.1 conserved hypothetical protein [Phenylobacterium zucineum HLK1]